MRLGNIRLVNYIGIYNGMKLNEIYIDLTKCKTNTIFIIGDNGSGKSTLWGAMHILPDPNNKFIPGKVAEKEITLIDNGIMYYIKFIHGIKANGTRDTTKAYITRTTSTSSEQLNPNGNVSGYYDVLRNTLDIDTTLIELSQLSSENRGLVDMTPTERKKTISCRIDCLEVYNNIYKNMCKKSSYYKSIKNNIIAKIQSLGTEENLIFNLTSIQQRLESLYTNKDDIINKIAECKNKIELLDPDNSIQNTYTEIYKELFNVDNELKLLKSTISIEEDQSILTDKLQQNILDIQNKTIRRDNLKNGLRDKINNRELESNTLNKKTEKLASLQSDKNYRDIELNINKLSKEIEEYNIIIKQIGLQNIDNISKDEFILGLNTLKEIKEIINVTRSDIEYELLSEAINSILNNQYRDTDTLNKELEEYENKKYEYSLELERCNSLIHIEEKLKLRPHGCKIDNCEFIKDAVLAHKENPSKRIIELDNLISINNDNIEKTKVAITKCIKINETINLLKRVIRSVESNMSIINKLPINNIFKNKEDMLNKILNGYDFKEIDDIYKYIDYSNIIDEYKFKSKFLHELQVEYKIYQSKSIMIEEILSDIEILNTKLNDVVDSITKDNEEIMSLEADIEILSEENIKIKEMLDTLKHIEELKNKKSDIIKRYDNIKEDMNKIKTCKNDLNDLNDSLYNIQKNIKPLEEEKDKINHYLLLLNDYNTELEIYNKKSEVVETIKLCSSPSKGIQTLYMQLYMGKTINMANELLAMMFGGEYILQNYIINESEFRIPCLGSGILNDDISSMSTSQKCMISMILSFVILKQSSDRYNILKIDEIDGGLDTRNRLQFSIVLDRLKSILNTEQLISISHNNEMDLSNSDIILLRYSGQDVINGNIIYDYNKL